jgi:hypothetical protein
MPAVDNKPCKGERVAVRDHEGRLMIRQEACLDCCLERSELMQRFAFLALLAVSSLFLILSQSAVACDHCVAKQKATQQASEGRMRHVGGSMGTARYEGVGFSTVSADDAMRKCCYWGQRTPTGIGVVRGNGGWYATVLYR